MKLWRLSHIKYADNAFSGEGSYLYGGRWSPPGCLVVYLSESAALCALETLVHVDAAVLTQLTSVKHVVFPVNVPDDLYIDEVCVEELTDGWDKTPAPESLQLVGKTWYDQNHSPLLRVPSAIVPTEHNYLFNPLHEDAARITIGEPLPFVFDQRLFK